jgi:transposase
MPLPKSQKKSSRRRYWPEFKSEALGLAEQIGVAGAAKEVGLHESQLYAWRKKARYEASRSETEKELAVENARLKRQLAKKEKAAAYFAKSLR